MPTRSARATFDVDTFTWSSGAFELCGTWQDAESGRVRLLVDVGGRRRNIGAAGGVEAVDGPGWRARFLSSGPPDADAGAVLLMGGQEIPLPTPEASDAPPPPSPDTGGDDGVRAAATLLQELRKERQALEQLRRSLADERRAAEALQGRQSSARRPAVSPRPEARPDPTLDQAVFWVAGAIGFLFLLVLIWVL